MQLNPAKNVEDIIHDKIKEKQGKGSHQCFHDNVNMRVCYLPGFSDMTQYPPKNPQQIPFAVYSCTHCGYVTSFVSLIESGVMKMMEEMKLPLPQENILKAVDETTLKRAVGGNPIKEAEDILRSSI